MLDHSLAIITLGPGHVRPLFAFYEGLTPAVTSFFLPFGHITEIALRAHLEGVSAGAHLSFGLADALGAIHGHAFILEDRGNAPTFGIGLDEAHQGRGHGRELMRHVLAAADDRGIAATILTVVKQNHRAIRLYETMGYSRTGEATFRTRHDSWSMTRVRPVAPTSGRTTSV